MKNVVKYGVLLRVPINVTQSSFFKENPKITRLLLGWYSMQSDSPLDPVWRVARSGAPPDVQSGRRSNHYGATWHHLQSGNLENLQSGGCITWCNLALVQSGGCITCQSDNDALVQSGAGHDLANLATRPIWQSGNRGNLTHPNKLLVIKRRCASKHNIDETDNGHGIRLGR